MDAKTGERGEHEAEEELRLLKAKVAGLPSEKGNETIARALPGVLFSLIPQGMVLHSFILLEILRFAAPSTKSQKHTYYRYMPVLCSRFCTPQCIYTDATIRYYLTRPTYNYISVLLMTHPPPWHSN